MNESKELIKEFKQKTLDGYLVQLTEPQRNLFDRMYPKGPTDSQMEWAIQQCINTLKKTSK